MGASTDIARRAHPLFRRCQFSVACSLQRGSLHSTILQARTCVFACPQAHTGGHGYPLLFRNFTKVLKFVYKFTVFPRTSGQNNVVGGGSHPVGVILKTRNELVIRKKGWQACSMNPKFLVERR